MSEISVSVSEKLSPFFFVVTEITLDRYATIFRRHLLSSSSGWKMRFIIKHRKRVSQKLS